MGVFPCVLGDLIGIKITPTPPSPVKGEGILTLHADGSPVEGEGVMAPHHYASMANGEG